MNAVVCVRLVSVCHHSNPIIVQAIAKWKGNPPEIPVVIGGQEYHTGNVQSQVSVSIHLITVSSSQGVCSQFVPLLSTL